MARSRPFSSGLWHEGRPKWRRCCVSVPCLQAAGPLQPPQVLTRLMGHRFLEVPELPLTKPLGTLSGSCPLPDKITTAGSCRAPQHTGLHLCIPAQHRSPHHVFSLRQGPGDLHTRVGSPALSEHSAPQGFSPAAHLFGVETFLLGLKGPYCPVH